MKKETPEVCPAQETVDLFGGKWKTTILYRISQAPAPMRFNELRRSIPRITQRMLTQQLRAMERDGLVIRDLFPEVPARVEYSLSDLGGTLLPIFGKLCSWTDRYWDEVETARKSYDKKQR